MNLALANAPAYSLGPLIHNSVAVEALEAQGVRVAQTVSDIPAGARAIIRSHGVSREVLNALEARAETIDATCPYVASIHRMVAEAAEAGIPVLVCGQREHPEVVGTMGWAGENARVVSSEDEARALPRMERALVVAQTTLGAARYRAIARAIEARVDAPDVRMTVCAATEKRQEEAGTAGRGMRRDDRRGRPRQRKLVRAVRNREGALRENPFYPGGRRARLAAYDDRGSHRYHSRRVHSGLYI